MKMNPFFKNGSLLLLAVLLGFTLSSCGDDEPDPEPIPLSSEAIINSFVFADLDPAVTATVSGTQVTATVPYDVDVTALTPTITVSDDATIAPASGVERDFSAPVTYVVTAEDGTEVTYTVTVNQEEPPMLAVSPVWERTLANGGLPEWFTANNNRGLAAGSEYVFVQSNNDRIQVVSAADGTDVAAGGDLGYINGTEIPATGVFANLLNVNVDNGGNIIGSTGALAGGIFRVSMWDDKDAAQEILLEYPTDVRLGDNIYITGNVDEDAIIYAPSAGTNQILKFTITGGVANTTPEVIELEGITSLGNAPAVWALSDAADANLILTGTGVGGIAEFAQDGSLVGMLPESLNEGETAMLFSFALDAAAFEIAGRNVFAATATDYTEGAGNDQGFLYLVDYTDGWENITADDIERVAFTPEGNIDKNVNATGGVDVVVNGDEATVYALLTNFGIGAYNVTFE